MQIPRINHQVPNNELIEAATSSHSWLKDIYKDSLFHGTGRYAKSKTPGKLVDLYKAIAAEGIKPHPDHIARILLPVEETISLTKQRVYARCYAELFGADHNQETHLKYTFGTTEAWKAYYFQATERAMKSVRNIGYIPTAIEHILTRFDQEERKRVRDVQHHKDRWFANKALVEGNHPIIFGVKTAMVKPLTLPQGLDYFEFRTAEVIDPKSLHLIEVPLAYIASTREALAKTGLAHLTVIPMEIGEVLSFMDGVTKCSEVHQH